MKTSITNSILATLVLVAPSRSTLPPCPEGAIHFTDPCERNVTSPPIPPTAAPSFSPTPLPTPSPTVATPSPTVATPSPTISTPSPTIATASPTPAPTENPTPSPTPQPTPTPTTSPTATPTSSPTSEPTFSPTPEPTGQPSSKPTEGCRTQNGVFGDINQEQARVIDFGYEMEYRNTADAEQDLIPKIETAIVDSILGLVFDECEPARRLRVSRRLEVTGVSRNPQDLILDDVVCGEVADGNECVVVGGALTLYASDAESAAALEEEIIDAIRSSMDNGELDEVDEDVVRVTYTELQSDGGPSGAIGGNNEQVGNSNTPVIVGALVAAGVVLAAVLGVAYKRKTKDEDATVSNFAEESNA